MTTPKVFISYSHEDEPWKEKLLSHLHVLERKKAAEIWDTSELQPGADWSKEIDKAIRKSDIAILLVSPSFLASDFIVNKELPALLDRRQKEGIAVIPILVRPSMWSEIPEIAELQFANDLSKPLSLASEAERDKIYLSISNRIAELAQAVAERSNTERHSARGLGILRPDSLPELESRDLNLKGHIFVSHSKEDGDFAELLKLKLERVGHDAWVDSDRLNPGIDWRAEIDQAIREATAILAIMSPEARASEYVTYEWAFAWGCGKKVIPIMLRQTTLHPRLATLQYLDFTNRIARPWARLFTALDGSNNPQRNGNQS